MSSANNHKRHTLEEEFQRRLFDAEASPAPDLWARIDHELTVQENKDYKKRAVFYRQLAAACFVLFALTGALLAYNYGDKSQQGQAPQGIAAASSADNTQPEPLTPEAAMKTYMQQHAEPAVVAQAPALQSAIPDAGAGKQSKNRILPGSALIPIAAEEAEMAPAYYNAAAGYSPFQGYYSGGSVAERNRYSQLITWESVTITFGNNSQAEQQQALSKNNSLAARPKSFAEMMEQYNALRSQKNEQQTEALASTLNKTVARKEDKQTPGSASRWSLNLAYTPTYFEQNIGLPDPMRASMQGRTLASASATADMQSFSNMNAARDEYENKTQPAFSYTMEVKTGFKLKEKLKLLTGIGYSENAARTKTNYIVRQFWVKPRTNERYQLEPTTIFLPSLSNGFTSDSISVARASDAFDVEYKYRHLSIPVGLQYEHDIVRDWFLYAAGGVAANFLIESSISASEREVQTVNYSPKDEDSPFRKMQLSGNMSIGVGKRISNNLTVVLGPEVRNYFSTLVAEPERAMAPQGRPYTLGMSMGLNYQLSNQKK